MLPLNSMTEIMTPQTVTKETFVFVLELFIFHKHFVLKPYVKEMLLHFCLVFCLDKVHFHINLYSKQNI